jgi:hypothetical protein
VRPGQPWGVEKQKFPEKNQPGLRKGGKKKVDLRSSPWLTQGQGRTKKVHSSVHHPSTLVHWWVLVHSGTLVDLILESGMKHIEDGRMVVE